jgi:AcrR family transcriptional regulator
MNKKLPKASARKPAKAPARTRRSRGRPSASKGIVGRHSIIVAARQLLEKMSPHQVTMALIARKAGVDPALVRYYFADREVLLFAVVENILADWAPRPPSGTAPADQLATHVANMLEFSSRVRSMQRLMVEECAVAKSPSVRARVRELNAHAIEHFAKMLRPEGDVAARFSEALFLHVAVIGMCEFFAAAQAMILPLAPKNLDATQVAAQYQDFMQSLVLDGIRKHLRPTDGRH